MLNFPPVKHAVYRSLTSVVTSSVTMIYSLYLVAAGRVVTSAMTSYFYRGYDPTPTRCPVHSRRHSFTFSNRLIDRTQQTHDCPRLVYLFITGCTIYGEFRYQLSGKELWPSANESSSSSESSSKEVCTASAVPARKYNR